MSRPLSPVAQKLVFAGLCSVFIAVGLGFWIPNFLLPLLEWRAMQRWKETPCTILKSPAGKEGTFGPEISYRYEFDGTTRESSDPGMTAFFAFGGDALRTLAPGTATVCYVDPRPPHRAALRRDLDPEIFVWCAPLLFVILPGFALVVGIRKVGRPPEADAPSAPEGSAILRNRAGSRGCGLMVQFTFLLVFGGLSALLFILPGFRETIVIRLVYLVPVGLVTLAILRGFVRSLFRTPAPEITLVVTPAEVHPGRMIEVRWEAKGVSDKAKSFLITLQGFEGIHAGKSTEEAVFDWIDVAKGGPKDLRRGCSKIHVPETTIPSLTHGSHRIRWAFRVAGEIPGIDGDGEQFEIEITPAKEKAS